MIDLILIKFIESALNSVGRPKGGFYIRIDSDTYSGQYIYNTLPDIIRTFSSYDVHYKLVEYTAIEFPLSAHRKIYINGKYRGNEKVALVVVESRLIRDMGYL
jgi:hypothetical protein